MLSTGKPHSSRAAIRPFHRKSELMQYRQFHECLPFTLTTAVVDYMTMSAPTTRVDLVDVKPNQGSGRKEPNMLIIGCDYHPSMQQIAFEIGRASCRERE